MGAAGAHPEASMGLRSFLAVWPSLVKGQAKCAQGPASPFGAGGGRGPRRDEAALWSHGVAQGPRGLSYYQVGTGTSCGLRNHF